MEIMTMQMTGADGVFSVPSEHLPGLIAMLALVPVLVTGTLTVDSLSRRGVPWASSLAARVKGLAKEAKVALLAMTVGAVVHAAIVPTHWADERVTAILFIVDTIGFAFACWWTFTQKRYWRQVDVAILGGTACGYALYLLTGWETADLVGLLTTTIELAAAIFVCGSLVAPLRRKSRQLWLGAASVPVALVALLGTTAVAGVTAASASATVSSGTSNQSGSGTSGMSGMSGMSGSGGSTTALSLATNSPAGPIVWPDDMSNMMTGMQMVTPDCDAQPTVAQQQAAVKLVDETVQAVAPYKSLAAAKAAGYVPVTPTGKKEVHYINPSIYKEGQALDPAAIPSLVYVNTDHGAVLVAAMYLMPRSAGSNPPQPGGCLTEWHVHTDLCFSTGGGVVGNDNSGSCPQGSENRISQPMMHVWVAPVPGGPLDPDPPALSEIQAADQLPVLSPPNGIA